MQPCWSQSISAPDFSSSSSHQPATHVRRSGLPAWVASPPGWPPRLGGFLAWVASSPGWPLRLGGLLAWVASSSGWPPHLFLLPCREPSLCSEYQKRLKRTASSTCIFESIRGHSRPYILHHQHWRPAGISISRQTEAAPGHGVANASASNQTQSTEETLLLLTQPRGLDSGRGTVKKKKKEYSDEAEHPPNSSVIICPVMYMECQI